MVDRDRVGEELTEGRILAATALPAGGSSGPVQLSAPGAIAGTPTGLATRSSRGNPACTPTTLTTSTTASGSRS